MSTAEIIIQFMRQFNFLSFCLCGNSGFAKDKYYSGGTIEKVSGVESAEECQGQCNANPDCNIFTHYSDKTCELKDELGNRAFIAVRFIITYL